MVALLVKKFLAVCGVQRFIFMFAVIRHWIPTWGSSVRSITYILILSPYALTSSRWSSLPRVFDWSLNSHACYVLSSRDFITLIIWGNFKLRCCLRNLSNFLCLHTLRLYTLIKIVVSVSPPRLSEFHSRTKQHKLCVSSDHLLSCCNIPDAHSGVADDSLLGCGAASFSVYLQTFRTFRDLCVKWHGLAL